jgi:regulator of protease activity HflC (stomatin/prohibitin superfamily)
MKKVIFFYLIGFVLVICGIFTYKMIGQNDNGYFLVKQSFGTGEMSVISRAGMYPKMMAKITPYKISDTYYFSKSELDGGKSESTNAINVRFAGGGTAMIDGNVRYRLPSNDESRLKLHEDFTNYTAIQNDLIRQYISETLKVTASVFKPEDTYAGRKGEFSKLFEDQLENGVYQTKSEQIIVKDADGNETTETIVKIVYDSENKPIVAKESPFKLYGIELTQVGLKDIDYDERTDTLIAKKQESEQQKIVSRAAAEKAKQDAITAMEQGKANTALAEANALVLKKTAVVEAEKEKEVAKLNALKEKEIAELDAQKKLSVAELNRKASEENAKALIVTKEAEAKTNKLLVDAGLTPREKAEIEMKTKIAVAEALSKVNVPTIVNNGSANGSNPMDAIGIKMLLDISEKMSK